MFSFAYLFGTTYSIVKSVKNASIVFADDFDLEENNTESEEPCEKSEKINFSDDFFHHKHNNRNLIALFAELGQLSAKQHNIFSCCYTQEVYSPPDSMLS